MCPFHLNVFTTEFKVHIPTGRCLSLMHPLQKKIKHSDFTIVLSWLGAFHCRNFLYRSICFSYWICTVLSRKFNRNFCFLWVLLFLHLLKLKFLMSWIDTNTDQRFVYVPDGITSQTFVSSFSIHLPFIRRYSFSKLRFLLVNLDFGTAFCTFSIFECCSILELVLFCLIRAPLTSLVKRNSRRAYKFYAPCSFVFLVLTLLLHILVY